ncbi:MAG: DUF1667 domain-containing protein [Acholeplasmataceae bacterium]|jgi:CxxC motif-containing protein|nr:DUF1667 domain-containing protein [Acholeplasmataceae bacterium]
MRELTCIICPVGCHIKVDDHMQISGNQCPRGFNYALAEITNPKRTLTTTVKTVFPHLPRLSIKSSEAVPKDLIFEIMKEINDVLITKHVKIGDIIIADIHHTGVDMVATKST